MAELYRFFGSTVDDPREYNQTEFAEVFKRFFRNGIFEGLGDSELKVVEQNPVIMAVDVGTGHAWVEGYWYKNNAIKSLPIPASEASPRIDRIVLHLDIVNLRVIGIQLKKGVAGASPLPPDLTRTDQIHELSLAQVYVGAGVTSVSNANITDERKSRSLCGWAVAHEVENTLSHFNSEAKTKVGDVYTIVEYKRQGGQLFMVSTLSNPDVNGYYQTNKWEFYNDAGTVIIETLTWALTYDVDGLVITRGLTA